MADRPQTIKEWATSSTAEIAEPSESLKKQGFGIAQPPVRFFNWILNNIYQWISYFDDSTLTEGEINTSFLSSRPRIHLPFTFKEGNKLNQIEVFKKSTADNIGGVSGSLLTGSSSISQGGLMPGSLTYVAGEFPEIRVPPNPSERTLAYNTTYRYNFSNSEGGVLVGSFIQYTTGVLFAFVRDDRPGFIFHATFSQRQSRGFSITRLNLNTADGSIREIVFNDNLSDELSFILRQIVRDNIIYLIGAVSSESMNLGKCIVWQIDDSNPAITWSNQGIATIDTGSLFPLFTNENFSDLRFFRVVKSYTAKKEELIGSSAGETTISDVAWNLESYRYDRTNKKVKIKLTPTQTDKALFHTFKIRQAGSDMLSLNSSDAEFASGQWTWNVDTDPITETGLYEFVFQTTGAGFNAFIFIKIDSNISIETYDGVDYLNIGSGSGVNNNDEILVRKV